ncbi:MAG: DUF3034 family protein [Pyrinomonadaceae bacterium]
MLRSLISKKQFLLVIVVIYLFSGSISVLKAQGLNWEGQTGALLTPFAYTSKSDEKTFGKPQVSFHYLAAGDVIGNHIQTSVTVGAAKRVEFGYTRNIAIEGGSPLAPLFSKDINIFHGKVNIVEENAGNSKALPAISAGFVARTNVKRAGGYLADQTETNGDVYVVATKTITQIKGLPIVLSGGVKATNASVMGIAGNSPDWKARGFGTVAAVVSGSSKTTVIVGAEAVQQPKYVKGLPGATVPTSFSYFTRIIPNKVPMAIDLAIVQAAGEIAPGVDLKARARFGMGISYQF